MAEVGEMAFRRLQLEIMKDSSDESIFAWRPKPDRYQLPNTKSVQYSKTLPSLASSPSGFRASSSIQPIDNWAPRAPYSYTNRGMSLQTALGTESANHSIFSLPLRCYDAKYQKPLASSRCPMTMTLYANDPPIYTRS